MYGNLSYKSYSRYEQKLSFFAVCILCENGIRIRSKTLKSKCKNFLLNAQTNSQQSCPMKQKPDYFIAEEGGKGMNGNKVRTKYKLCEAPRW